MDGLLSNGKLSNNRLAIDFSGNGGSGGSTAWDLNKFEGSYDVSTQSSNTKSVFFKSDGTSMYVVDVTSDFVYQYTLSTPWDVSTASYASKSFSVSTQEASPYDLFFKSDGSKMYIVGLIGATIYQYTLSTPWDVSTASYDSKSLSVSSQDTNPRGVFIDASGTKVYIAGNINDTVFQYTLSTPWDISTGTYASKSFSVATQDVAPHGLFFKPDGSKMYILGENTDFIYQYTLGTLFDVSTATYNDTRFDISEQDSTGSGLFFKPDGLNFFIAGQNNYIYQYKV